MGALSHADLKSKAESFLNCLPLVSSPAVKTDEYSLELSLISTRAISGTALTIIAMVGLYWVCPLFPIFAPKYVGFLLLSGAVLLPCIFKGIERYRASHKADEKAVVEYIEKTIPAAEATGRLSSSPRAFRLLLEKTKDFNKLDTSSETLISKMLSKQVFWSLDITEDLDKLDATEGSWEVCKILIDAQNDVWAPIADGKSLFMWLIERWDVPSLRYLLETKKVSIPDEKEQAKIWKEVRIFRIMELLVKHGFNINAKDQDGCTPLMHWVKNKEDTQFIVKALNLKADPLIEKDGKKASDLVGDNKLLKKLLEQAEKEFGKDPVEIPQEKWMTWLPWKPVVRKARTYSAASDTLLNRILCVALTFFLLCPIIPIKVFIGASIIAVPLSVADDYRGVKEARRQAVMDYLNNPIPSRRAITTIGRDVKAANLLIANKGAISLDKFDQDGYSLLGRYPNPEVFKLLLEKGANILSGVYHDGLLHLIEEGNLDSLQLILSKGLIAPATIDQDLQVEMWKSIKSIEVASLLKKQGFDPDIKNTKGNTALIELVEKKSISKILILLDSGIGASKHITGANGQTAKQLAEELNLHPQVRDLL